MKCPIAGCLHELSGDVRWIRGHLWDAHRVPVDDLDVIVMVGNTFEDDEREEDQR